MTNGTHPMIPGKAAWAKAARGKAALAAFGLALALALVGCDAGGGGIHTASHNLKMGPSPSGDTDNSGTTGDTATKPDSGGAKPAEASASSKVTSEYKLGPGDQLQVAVFGQPDLSGKFEVDGTGNLVLPLIGPIKAEGKTVPELQQAVITEYDKSFLVNAKVNIQVLNYRPFYILGEIGKPGSYPYVVSLTIRQAVAIAGGYTRRAKEAPVEVLRAGASADAAEEAMPDDPVLPGDTIQVNRRLF